MARVIFNGSPVGFLIDGRDTLFVQSDWEYAGVAGRMGWTPCCGSGRTDGTIDCPDCGKTASAMLVSAFAHIVAHAGERFPELDDYFQD